MGGAIQEARGQLGMKLRSTRLKLGMTQADVARKVGLDQTTISAIERGQGEDKVRAIMNKWLDDPAAKVEHASDALLEAAAATGEADRRLALVRTWIRLYGEERDDD